MKVNSGYCNVATQYFESEQRKAVAMVLIMSGVGPPVLWPPVQEEE